MSVLKRPIGRRVTGAFVGATLMVLGLAAPAFAVPAITGFSPASGPDGCLIVVTGSGFLNPDIEAGDVDINGVDANFEVQSDTEIWVEANGETGFITVTNSLDQGPATSAPTAFQDTTDAGACAPTVTLLEPSCGLVGTPVTITGTNLISGTAFASGTVEFSPFVGGVGKTGTATGVPDTPTALHVSVPVDAETGPIQLTTVVDDVLSEATFTVVTDLALCPTTTPTEHARTVTLKLRKHLIAKGKVTADPELAECIAGVTVKIQRKKSGSWKTVGKATTNDAGAYKKSIKDKPGKYRSRIGKTSIGDPVTDVCLGDKSPVVKHSH